MGIVLRGAVVFAATVANLASAIVYYRAGLPIIELAQQDKWAGPMSSVLPMLETLVPVALLIIELGVLLWFVYGSAQTERTQRERLMRGGR
jgi:hypothetical protein